MRVGQQWASAISNRYRSEGLMVRFALDGRSPIWAEGRRSEVPDLDRPSLWRPLCAPLQRQRLPQPDLGAGPKFAAFAYSPPFGRSMRDRFELAQGHAPLRVGRCGHARPVTLSHCRDGCRAVRFGAGAVAWVQRQRIHVYRATGRPTSRSTRPFGARAVAIPTPHALVVSTGGRGQPFSIWLTSP
jgi:hypothetical protein